MAIPYRKTWRRFLPNIQFFISLPLVRLETRLGYERLDMYQVVEWFQLNIKVGYWKTELRLFSHQYDERY